MDSSDRLDDWRLRRALAARIDWLVRGGADGRRYPRTNEGRLMLQAAVRRLVDEEFPEIDPDSLRFDEDFPRGLWLKDG
jgi:hypothetical protein